MSTRTERIEMTECFEMTCRVNGYVPGGWSVDCTFVYGYSPKRRKPGKQTCVVRGHGSFDSFGGRGHTDLTTTERLIPEIGCRTTLVGVGEIQVVELPTDGSPWLRLRRV